MVNSHIYGIDMNMENMILKIIRRLESENMICLDCGNMDIRYDEKEKSYHCNNCGSRNIGTRKEGCKYMLGNGLCGKNPACTSSGECEAPCSYYEKQ